MKKGIVWVTALLSVCGFAQQKNKKDLSAWEAIQQEEWYRRDAVHNSTTGLSWSDTELRVIVKGDDQGYAYTLPVSVLMADGTKVALQTGEATYSSGSKAAIAAMGGPASIPVLSNALGSVDYTADALVIEQMGEPAYTYYSMSYMRMRLFLERYDWQLIAVNRQVNEEVDARVTFDFDQGKLLGKVDGMLFCVDFVISQSEGQLSFGSFDWASKARGKAGKKLQQQYKAHFNQADYRFDIAEQTLNLYQGDQLVLMFGLTSKE